VSFESDVDDILRELLREPGILATSVAPGGDDHPRLGPLDQELSGQGVVRHLPLGSGVELTVLLETEPSAELQAMIERVARELRACIRRFVGEEVPEVTLIGRARRPRATLLGRITTYLQAFATMHAATAAVVLVGSEIVALGGTLGEAHRERLTFLRKRLCAEAKKSAGKSSHAEVYYDDVYACSFWYDAYLVAFFDAAYSVDFVRHRARAVARELAMILPHLDDDPTTPALMRPPPA
jgi:hypothetical protein